MTPSAEYLERCTQFTLPTLRVELPDLNNGNPLCACAASDVISAVMVGTAGVTYTLQAQIRGWFEEQGFHGGTANGNFYTGGAPDTADYNYYKIEVSDPVGNYFLNNGSSQGSVHDYTAEIQIKTGATVTLRAVSQDNQEFCNGNAQSVPGVTNLLPNRGQFAQVDFSRVNDPILPMP